MCVEFGEYDDFDVMIGRIKPPFHVASKAGNGLIISCFNDESWPLFRSLSCWFWSHSRVSFSSSTSTSTAAALIPMCRRADILAIPDKSLPYNLGYELDEQSLMELLMYICRYNDS